MTTPPATPATTRQLKYPKWRYVLAFCAGLATYVATSWTFDTYISNKPFTLSATLAKGALTIGITFATLLYWRRRGRR